MPNGGNNVRKFNVPDLQAKIVFQPGKSALDNLKKNYCLVYLNQKMKFTLEN